MIFAKVFLKLSRNPRKNISIITCWVDTVFWLERRTSLLYATEALADRRRTAVLQAMLPLHAKKNTANNSVNIIPNPHMMAFMLSSLVSKLLKQST